MGGWTNEWMDGWMDAWVDGRMNGWMDGWIDGGEGWMDGRMDACIYACCLGTDKMAMSLLGWLGCLLKIHKEKIPQQIKQIWLKIIKIRMGGTLSGLEIQLSPSHRRWAGVG